MTRMILLDLPQFSTMPKFLCQFLCHRTSNASHGYGSEIIDKLVDFYGPSRSMVLEVERLDEPNDNPEQRAARWDFYKRNGFKTSNAFGI